ncbi:MAG: Tad domain-containing protein [Hyphomonadaceae bacterium]|nr:Tad domain-containing protein [Hyphomonadaceae bacterium]
MIWALASVVMLGIVGLSIDFSRANTSKAALQNAVDAAALAIGAKPNLSQTEREALAATYLRENFGLDASMGTPILSSVVTNDNDVVVSARVDVPTTLGALFTPRLSPNASSRVVWGQTKLWVSLALDNTGSMLEKDVNGVTKLSSLITATNQLIDMLEGVEVNPGDIEVSLIPFSKTVKAGLGNVAAAWIDWTDWEAPPLNVATTYNGQPLSKFGPQGTYKMCPWRSSSNGYACQTNSTNGSSTYGSTTTITNGTFCPSRDNGSKNAGRGNRYYNGCYNSVKTVASCTSNCTYTHTWTSNAHGTWSGCIMDRNQSYDVNMTTPTSAATRFPAENGASCVPSEMLGGLGHNWGLLRAKTDAMTAGGNTNQTIGLAWAMMSQTPGAPFNAPSVPEFTTRYIILMSDGLNTQNRWSSSQSAINARMTAACVNAKQDGFVIYSIYVDTGGSGNSAVMEACASDSSKYYALTTSGSIVTAFNQIGQEITKLRVAH